MPDLSLIDAYAHSSRNEAEVLRSARCACFHCEAVFAVAEIGAWIDDEPQSALCPRCGFDAVLGDACGYPILDAGFLTAMRRRWFEAPVSGPLAGPSARA